MTCGARSSSPRREATALAIQREYFVRPRLRRPAAETRPESVCSRAVGAHDRRRRQPRPRPCRPRDRWAPSHADRGGRYRSKTTLARCHRAWLSSTSRTTTSPATRPVLQLEKSARERVNTDLATSSAERAAPDDASPAAGESSGSAGERRDSRSTGAPQAQRPGPSARSCAMTRSGLTTRWTAERVHVAVGHRHKPWERPARTTRFRSCRWPAWSVWSPDVTL